MAYKYRYYWKCQYRPRRAGLLRRKRNRRRSFSEHLVYGGGYISVRRTNIDSGQLVHLGRMRAMGSLQGRISTGNLLPDLILLPTRAERCRMPPVTMVPALYSTNDS